MESEFLKPDPNLLHPLLGVGCAIPADKTSLAYRAAYFSLYTPLAIIFIGMALLGPIQSNRGAPLALALLVAGGLLQLAFIQAAFISAAISFRLGIKRRAAEVIYLSSLSLFLNGGMLACWLTAILAHWKFP